MSKELERLQSKLNKVQAEFDNRYNNSGDLGFIMSGNLSKGSRNRVDRNHKALGKLSEEISLLKIAIKVASEETFTLKELDRLQIGKDHQVNVYVTSVGIMEQWVRDAISSISSVLSKQATIYINIGENRIIPLKP